MGLSILFWTVLDLEGISDIFSLIVVRSGISKSPENQCNIQSASLCVGLCVTFNNPGEFEADIDPTLLIQSSSFSTSLTQADGTGLTRVTPHIPRKPFPWSEPCACKNIFPWTESDFSPLKFLSVTQGMASATWVVLFFFINFSNTSNIQITISGQNREQIVPFPSKWSHA